MLFANFNCDNYKKQSGHHWPIPYIGPVQTKFIPGRIIKIQGTVPGIADRFNINLQCGPQTAPQDDIALQISVRIIDGCIVLNSLQRGIWDDEQRNATLPIKRGERFEIILLCELKQYKAIINGQHYCEYPQRIQYDRISHLAINGDVSISEISYESGMPKGIAGVINNTVVTKTSLPHGTHSAPPPGFLQLSYGNETNTSSDQTETSVSPLNGSNSYTKFMYHNRRLKACEMFGIVFLILMIVAIVIIIIIAFIK